MLLDITFENRSQLPIAITDVHVFLNNHELTVEKYPLCVEEYSHLHGKEVVDRKFLYNLEFPIAIQQLGLLLVKCFLSFLQKSLKIPPLL